MTPPKLTPWLWFAGAVALCLAFALGAGSWIVATTQPTQLGRSNVGGWAELAEAGFRVRLDGVALADSLPSSYDPASDVAPPEGFQFLRVQMTVESLVGPDEAIGCLVQLRNRDGEEIGHRNYGLDGPAATDCNQLAAEEENGRPILAGDSFKSQSVFVVQPDDIDSFTVDIVPLFVDDDVFWTFTLG